MRGASFVEAADYAVAYARQHKLVSESGFFNPARREGLKLAFLEACDQVPEPIDWYVQAVSSAMGVYGAFKGAKNSTTLVACINSRVYCACNRKAVRRWRAHFSREANQFGRNFWWRGRQA